MAVFNEPSKWQTSLVNSGDANTIPQSTPAGTGEASFEDGFPQITQVPIGAGGIAPDRKDFNGLFKILGDWIFFAQNGGLPTYSADFDYVVGRYVVYNNTLYKCIQANGASSIVVAPDSVSPLGSDYWKDIENTDLTNKADKDFFNVTAPTQAFKDMSIGWGLPDYDSKIDISSNMNTSYTATFDGYILGLIQAHSNSGLYISLGSTYDSSKSITGVSQTGSQYVASTIFAKINKGETYYLTKSGTIDIFSLWAVPCKGV